MTDLPKSTSLSQRSGRRFCLALAASLLLHAGAAAFIGFMPVAGRLEEAAPRHDLPYDLCRPVQITFVPTSPRGPIAPESEVAPAPHEPVAQPPEPQRAEDPPPAPKPQRAPPPAEPNLAPPAPVAEAAAADRAPHPPLAAPSPPHAAATQPIGIPGPLPAKAASGREPGAGSGEPLGPVSGSGGTGAGQRPSATPATGAGGAPAGRAPAPSSTPRGGVRAQVEMVSLPTPEYPPRSRRLGEEGLVLLEVEVLPDGRAGKVRVLQAPPYERLVEAAIEVVRRAKFKPATVDGTAVRATVEVPIRFKLHAP